MNRILITLGTTLFLSFIVVTGSTADPIISKEATLIRSVKNICMDNINNPSALLKAATDAGFVRQPTKPEIPPEIVTLKKATLVLDYDTKERACSMTETVSYKEAVEMIVPMFGLVLKDYTYLTNEDGSLVAVIGIFNSTKEPTFEFNLVFPPSALLKEQPHTKTNKPLRVSVIVYETATIKNSRISI